MRGAGLLLPGSLAITPRPAARTLLSPAVPHPSLLPIRTPRRVPVLPGTCGPFSRGPLPSRRSERPWMLAGIGAGRGRPLVEVATVAAARVAAPGRAAGRARQDRRLLLAPARAQRLPAWQGCRRTLPRADLGVPGQDHSRLESSRPMINHKEELRPRTARDLFQSHIGSVAAQGPTPSLSDLSLGLVLHMWLRCLQSLSLLSTESALPGLHLNGVQGRVGAAGSRQGSREVGKAVWA